MLLSIGNYYLPHLPFQTVLPPALHPPRSPLASLFGPQCCLCCVLEQWGHHISSFQWEKPDTALWSRESPMLLSVAADHPCGSVMFVIWTYHKIWIFWGCHICPMKGRKMGSCKLHSESGLEPVWQQWGWREVGLIGIWVLELIGHRAVLEEATRNTVTKGISPVSDLGRSGWWSLY